ncbi:hypothetical protein [Ancylobacter moscoviensis]
MTSMTEAETKAAPDPVKVAREAVASYQRSTKLHYALDELSNAQQYAILGARAMQEDMAAHLAAGGEPVAFMATSGAGGKMVMPANMKTFLVEDAEKLYRDCGYTITPLYARPAPEVKDAAPPAKAAVHIQWTPELERARVDLCYFWLKIADDPHEGGARYPELGRRAIETEQALTILGEIAGGQAEADRLLKVALEALDNYADPSGYRDNYGEEYTATDNHPGSLARNTAARIRSALVEGTETTAPAAGTWDHRYRPLITGEIIQAGDECLTDSHLGWQTEVRCIGKPAPDPSYTSHRMYRRLVDTPAPAAAPDGLVERLRGPLPTKPALDGRGQVIDFNALERLVDEAAARIEADAAEKAAKDARIAKLEFAESVRNQLIKEERDAAEARVKELEEAAEFVDESAVIFGPNGDEAVSFAAMAKLRAALAKQEGGANE